ncbi:MAG: hypothetical protein UY76_C0043G0005 [Candidatus Uhrbacteria bacterium GW2011_GWA2_52_8d]|uniref:Uncharacterized protein n=1 Tax=Candidatus Uhrbacteria bacterium GW2011_GWA2_52_8d TaxID=1618979 RepID=A0A0G1XMH5_9BACT|nr:MAG: hypothetical protein UY76_C0043G0005 [Candidatus Uhrbacteria bacterium GW2011_GWA2_52_8d]
MLKLVYSRSRRDSTDAEDSRALGRALDEMTLGISPRLFIFEEHQAHVLFEVLRCYRFSQEDLDKWIQRLYADHPYIRARVSTAPRGLLGHLLNLPPRMVPTGETINDWIDRAGKFVNAVRESPSVPDRFRNVTRRIRPIAHRSVLYCLTERGSPVKCKSRLNR